MKSKTNNYKSYKVNKVNERGDDSSGNNTQCFTIQYVPMNREWPCICTMYRELCIHLLYVLNRYFQNELDEISHLPNPLASYDSS